MPRQLSDKWHIHWTINAPFSYPNGVYLHFKCVQRFYVVIIDVPAGVEVVSLAALAQLARNRLVNEGLLTKIDEDK